MMYLWMSKLDLYCCCLLDTGSDSSPEYDRLDTSVLIIFILFITHITQYNKIDYTSFDVMMRTFSKMLYFLSHACTMILCMIHTSFDVMMRTFSKMLYFLSHACTMILCMIHFDIKHILSQ